MIHNLSPKSDLESQVGGWDWELWGKFTGARVAQWIRRRSPKPKIGGSSPVGTNVFCWLINPCAKEVLFNISTNGAFIANIGDVAQW